MAERSIAWTTNATGDGTSGGYSAANWQNMNLKMFITNPATEGVLYGIGNNLAVTGSASPVAVNTGSGLVYGIWYENDASVNVTIPTPASNPRIDRVVLRASWSAQTVRITRIAGTEAASPTAPAMTQVANTTWDVPLAQVRITTGGVITLTDERTYIKHPGVYGWLQQANAWAGNQSVAGNVAATGRLTSDWSGGGSVSGVYINSTAPALGWRESDAAANNRVWDMIANGETLLGRAISDDDSSAGTWVQVDRTGFAIDSVTFPSGTVNITNALNAGSLNASQLGSGAVPIARMPTSGFDAGWVTAGTLAAARLAADSVDDTIVGNRVPQFYRRQGGSSSDWSVAGTSTQTPAMVRMQAGAYTASASASPVTITFPVAFSQPPIFVALGNGDVNIVTLSSITASQANIIVRDRSGSYNGGVVNWIAIGPE